MFDDDDEDGWDIEEILRAFNKHRKFKRRRKIDGHCYNVHEEDGIKDQDYFVEQTTYLVDGHKMSLHKHQFKVKRK